MIIFVGWVRLFDPSLNRYVSPDPGAHHSKMLKDGWARIEMPDMLPFEKKEKEVFFRIPPFFSGTKKNLFLFSQKDTYLAFQFLSPSVLLSCYHHLKAKNGMYFCPSIFEHFRMVCYSSTGVRSSRNLERLYRE